MLACVRTANLYLLSIVNHIKITPCKHPDDGIHRAQIDHILLREKWRNSIRKCRAYSTTNLDSNHRIVTANLKISIQVPHVDQKIAQRNIQALNSSTDLQELHQIEVSNRFAALSNILSKKTPQEKYDEIVNILEKVNDNVLPKKVTHRDKWISQQTESLVKIRVTLRNKYRNPRNQDNDDNWREPAKLTDESFENDHQQFLENKCFLAEEAAHLNQSSKVYSMIKDISGKSTTNTAKLGNKQNGESPTDNDELIKEWAAYFKELLNVRNDERSTEIPPASADLDICTDNFTLHELRKAINKMKPNKSPGTNFAVTAGNELQNAVLDICNSVLNDLGVPSQWTESIIVPIPKKASKAMKDFCGISLMSIAAKVYNRMLLNRIYDTIDKLLRPYQAGFRRDRNCLEQIHILRRVMEAYYQCQLPLIVVLIDFKKALDSIDREMI